MVENDRYHDGNQDQSSIVMILQRRLTQNQGNFQEIQPDQAQYDPAKCVDYNISFFSGVFKEKQHDQAANIA